MEKSTESNPTPAQTNITIHGDNNQVIYADRILNAGFGSFVSRLTLGLEKEPNQYAPFATLVIPTPVLIETLEAMLNALNENVELKNGMVKGLDTFKEQLTKLK